MDEAEFKQAIRLLHIERAWFHAAATTEDPARSDPLYPGEQATAKQRPLLNAINGLLEKYPYERLRTENTETATP